MLSWKMKNQENEQMVDKRQDEHDKVQERFDASKSALAMYRLWYQLWYETNEQNARLNGDVIDAKSKILKKLKGD